VHPLVAARKALGSAHKDERERGEATLLQSRDAAVPHLIDAMLHDGVIARPALLLMALHARAALPALYTIVERERSSDDELAFIARALAELLEGQDAFDDRARSSLEKLAASRDRSTRAFAAQAYGSLGDLRSKARVQALARDSDAWVREKASAVLAKLAETEALANESNAPIDFAALVDRSNTEGGALKPYLDDLGDARRPVRAAAVAELVRAGKSAVPFLLDKLNQPSTRARISAAIALGQLQNTEAAGPLLVAATAPASTTEEQELRAVALRSLASCLTGQEEGLAASILPLARDGDRFVRAAALLCLGRLADRQGLHAIVSAILEDDPFVVESAAVALSEGVRESDVEVVLPLLSALDKRAGSTSSLPSPTKSGAGAAVKEAILLALSRVAIDAPALKVRVRHRVRREIMQGVPSTSSSRKAAIALLEKLYDSEQADPPPVPLVEDVLARLHDDHPEVRVVAASFLRAHLEPGMTGAVASLSQALRRGESTVSLLVLEALRRHDTSDAKAALEQAAAAAASAPAAESVAQRARELLVDFQPHTTTWQHLSKLPQAATLPPRAESTRPPMSVDPKDPKPPRVRTPGDHGANVVEARFDDK
jgi:HEAT repeat protein